MSFVLLRESALWKQIWVHVLHERERPFDIAGKSFWMEYASHKCGHRLTVWKEITPRYRWIRIKVTLSIRLPRLLLTSKFTPFSPSSIAIFYTFVSFSHSEGARLGERVAERTSSGSDWCLPAACAAGHRSHSICRPGIGFQSDQRRIPSFILFHPRPRYRPQSP